MIPSSRPRVERIVPLVLALVLLALALAPRPAAADPVPIGTGSMSWGFKESWRRYVGEAGTTLSEGVVRAPGGGFEWPIVSGTYDADTKALDVRLRGKVHFAAHNGELDTTIANPRVVMSRERAEVRYDVRSKNMDGVWVEFADGPVADLDVAAVEPDLAGGTTSWSAVPATLTAQGSRAFTYGIGTVLDPFALTYAGPGGKPDTRETWTVPGTLRYDVAPVATLMPDVTYEPWVQSAHIDAADGVVHMTGEIADPATGTRIFATDVATGAVLGYSERLNGTLYAYDRATNTVFVGGNGPLFAYRWNATTRTYARTDLHTGTFSTAMAWVEASRTLVLTGQREVVLARPRAGGGHTVTVHPFTGVDGQPMVGAVDAGGTLLVGDTEGSERLYQLVPQSIGLVATPVPGLTDVRADALVVGADGQAWVADGWRTRAVQRLRKDADGRYRPDGDPVRTGTTTQLHASSDGRRVFALAPWENAVHLIERQGHVGILRPTGPQMLGYLGFSVEADGSLLMTHPVATPPDPQQPAKTPWALTRATVAAVSPTVTQRPRAATVRLGAGEQSQAVSFTVAASGQPAPSVRWQSRGGPTGRFRDLDGATGATLDLVATRDVDGTQYRAVFANATGELATEPAPLRVLHAPEVGQQPDSIAVLEGEDALLKVLPVGNPRPEVTWQVKSGGTWTAIDADGDQFEVAGEGGGFLTVKGATAEQSGTQLRARLSNEVGTTWSNAATLTVQKALTDRVTFGGGHVDWGFAERWRCYVVGSVARGAIELSDGVTRNAGTLARGGLCNGRNGGSESLRFPVRGGAFDPTSGRLELDLDGSVRFWGHDYHRPGDRTPQLDTRFSKLRIVAEGGTATLYADAVGATMNSPQRRTQTQVALTTVELAGSGPARTAGGLAWTAAPTTLTAAGAEVFGSYTAGEAMDPITLAPVFGTPRVEPSAPQPQPQPQPQPRPAPQPAPKPVPRAAAKRATVTPAKRAQRVDRKRIATLATLACPRGVRGGACAVKAPSRVRVRIAGRTHTATVLAPKRIGHGARATLRVRLTKAAAARLGTGRRRATVSVPVTVTANGATVRRLVTVTLLGRRA